MPNFLVDLERFILRCRHSGHFVRDIWVQFAVSTTVVAFLDTHSQIRVLRSCIVVYVDRSEVALGSTSVRLHCIDQAWTVATPPLQAFSAAHSTTSSWWSSDSGFDDGPEAQEGAFF